MERKLFSNKPEDRTIRIGNFRNKKRLGDLSDKQLKNIAHWDELTEEEKKNVRKNEGKIIAGLTIPSSIIGGYISKKSAKGALIGGGIGASAGSIMAALGRKKHTKDAKAAKEVLRNRQKEYSLSRRTKQGISGALKGSFAGIGMGGALGLLGGSGMNGKQKLALSLASMILTIPFSAWAGYKAGVEIYDKEHPSLPPLIKKTPNKEIENLSNKLSKIYPELIGLQKIEEDKELKLLEPKWGDGDEYPVFSLILNTESAEEDFIPILSYDFQEEELGINPVKKFWCASDNPGKRINLKSYLQNKYTFELKEYENAKKKNSYGFDNQEDYDEVISWINCVLQKIKQYL